MYAEINGVRLWFDILSAEYEIGEDEVRRRPTVIEVHGGPGIDSTVLITELAPLGDIARTVRFDQRGHGRSDRGQPGDWNLETWADDLAGPVRAVGVGSAVLLGTSFGARVALTCAIRHPNVVSGVIAAYGGGVSITRRWSRLFVPSEGMTPPGWRRGPRRSRGGFRGVDPSVLAAGVTKAGRRRASGPDATDVDPLP